MVSFLGSQAVAGSAPIASTGLPRATSGASNTKGAWLELIAATPHDAAWLLLNIGVGSTGDSLVDVGIGADGSETVLIPNIPYVTNTSTVNVTLRALLPVAIPAGTRIAIRHQAATASRTIDAGVMVLGRIAGGERGLGGVETLGVNTGTSRATAVDAGASADTKGAWVQIGTASTFPYKWLCAVVTHPESIASDRNFAVDIGIGPTTGDVVIVPDMGLRADATTDAFMEQAWCFPCSIPAGTVFWARAQCSATNSPDRIVDVAIVGVG